MNTEHEFTGRSQMLLEPADALLAVGAPLGK